MKKLRTAVVGVGYLGKFHAQKYATLDCSQLIAVCDTNAENAAHIAQQCSATAYSDYRVLADLVDAVSIVTPTPTHHKIARFFLERGIHVLLEKPIAMTLNEADDLIATARATKAILQIGHIERFNNVLQSALPLLDQPYFIECWRLAPFKLRGSEVSVILDMMIHDIEIIHHIFNAPVKAIHATGSSVYSPHTDVVNARIEFNNGCVANLNASRIHPRISRRMHILQAKNLLNLDLQYKKINFYQFNQFENSGVPITTRKKLSYPKDDPLREEIADFLTAILENKLPRVSGEDGRTALATALKITDSIVNHSHIPAPVYV